MSSSSLNADLVRMTLELSRMQRRTMVCRQQAGQGVDLIRFYALSILKENKNRTMTEFAKLMNVSPSTVTAFVDRLAQCGLVRRVPDVRNRKKMHLQLMKKGERMLVSERKNKEQLLEKMFVVLSAKDRAHLRRILSLLLRTETR